MGKQVGRTRGQEGLLQGANACPTIALLCDRLVNQYSCNMWRGVADAACEFGFNLIYFAGGVLDYPYGYTAKANVLYELVNPDILDGLVLWGSQLGRYSGVEKVQALCERYRPLPMVNVGVPLEGIPSLVADCYPGMREAIAHLIEVHGYRRIAFIRGPESSRSAQERYQAYTDVLAEHDIPFDPTLVVSEQDIAEFLRRNPRVGNEAAGIYILLDDRGLRPKVDLEAVVGNGDGITLAVLSALHERKIRVPDDVALASFDDLVESRYSIPPLTTVRVATRSPARQPIYDMGRQAVELLSALMRGETVPEVVTLPSELVLRQSCGCTDAALVRAAARPVVRMSEPFEVAFADRRKELSSAVIQAVEASGVIRVDPQWIERLLDGFAAAMTGGDASAFWGILGDILRQMVEMSGDLGVWQEAISVLRRYALPCLAADTERLERAEDLWHQARVLVANMTQRAQAYQALQAERQASALREVGEILLATFAVDKLVDMLAEELPRLGIPGFYLSLYEDPENPARWAWLALAYGEEGRARLGDGGIRFLSRRLLPEGLWPRKQPYSLVVGPLYSRDTQLGFVLYEVGPREGLIYETLAAQISSALHGALLVQRVREHSAELARQQYILDTFMENVPALIYFKDLDGRITRASKSYATQMGLSDPAELIGKSDFDFFPEEQARIKYEQEQEIIRTGRPLLNLEDPDGRGHWGLTTKMPLRDEHGEIIGTFGFSQDITAMKEAQAALERAYAEVEQQVRERTAALEREMAERERLQQEVIEAQQRAIRELSTPIIPVVEGVIVMPLIGSIDTLRARDVTRALLAGIREHHAKVVILDITGVPIVDSGVAAYLNKTIQAARLKGAHTIVTGVSEAVAETIVDLGIDWSGLETVADLQTGLKVALAILRGRR